MDKSMIIRTIVLAIALLNQFLVMGGLSPLPFESQEIEYGVTAVFTTIATLWTYWKNNSITRNARTADEYLRHLRNEDKKSK